MFSLARSTEPPVDGGSFVLEGCAKASIDTTVTRKTATANDVQNTRRSATAECFRKGTCQIVVILDVQDNCGKTTSKSDCKQLLRTNKSTEYGERLVFLWIPSEPLTQLVQIGEFGWKRAAEIGTRKDNLLETATVTDLRGELSRYGSSTNPESIERATSDEMGKKTLVPAPTTEVRRTYQMLSRSVSKPMVVGTVPTNPAPSRSNTSVVVIRKESV